VRLKRVQLFSAGVKNKKSRDWGQESERRVAPKYVLLIDVAQSIIVDAAISSIFLIKTLFFQIHLGSIYALARKIPRTKAVKLSEKAQPTDPGSLANKQNLSTQNNC
jgi:hypothetical protein